MRRKKFIFVTAATGVASYSLSLCWPALGSAPPATLTPVRVRLFHALDVERATISANIPDAPVVRLDASSAVTEISSQGVPLTVKAYQSDGTTIERRYAGSIRSSTIDGKLMLVNEVDLESYVTSVLASEISPGWHPETLRAQAVAVRTYAWRRMGGKRGALYDVVDDTSNQVYRGVNGIVPSLFGAASTTAGQVLAFGGTPADVWYHSACGGHTAASFEVTGGRDIAYLRGTPDTDPGGRAYCSISPYYTWRNSLSPAAVARVADVESKGVSSLSVADRWPDGRARTVRVQTSDGATHDTDGHAFYARAGAVLGYKVVPSALFDVAQGAGGAYVLSGHGVGHGVGMCQWGAEGRSRKGQNAGQILVAYFPGTTLTAVTP